MKTPNTYWVRRKAREANDGALKAAHEASLTPEQRAERERLRVASAAKDAADPRSTRGQW